jgi:hypothetical protein
MLCSDYQVERPAAAGRPRAIAVVSRFAPTAGIAGAFATGLVWTVNPSPMGVKATKAHDLTPAQRPEEAVPR